LEKGGKNLATEIKGSQFSACVICSRSGSRASSANWRRKKKKSNKRFAPLGEVKGRLEKSHFKKKSLSGFGKRRGFQWKGGAELSAEGKSFPVIRGVGMS